MPDGFHNMYSEKVNKLLQEQERKAAMEAEKNRRKYHLEEENNYKTTYNERGTLVPRRSEKSDEEPLNISLEVVRKRVSHLKKPRNILSTQ